MGLCQLLDFAFDPGLRRVFNKKPAPQQDITAKFGFARAVHHQWR